MDNQTIIDRLESGESVYGFFLTGGKQIDEIGCKMWTLQHECSGGKVVFVDTKTEEKSFALSFPAFPMDDTGVFHIIEHCLVGAGEKYRVNRWCDHGPQKSFFSAFTCLDSSVYPVCSKNEKAFQDLVRLYSDSVFSSQIRSSDLPMMQEGWHYEYNAEADELSCSGIVYSEVKAAHDLPDYIVTLTRLKAAFPDSPYAKDIGGAPEYVPSLTREHFLEVYQSIFQPANCVATICGDTNLAEVLETLSPYFNAEPAAANGLRCQASPAVWDGSPLFGEYPASKEERGQAIIGFNWVFGPERRGIISSGVVVSLLEQRFTERLISLGLCTQVSFTCDCEPIYPIFTLTLYGAKSNVLDRAREEILYTVKTLLENGVTQKQFETSVAAAEFAIREGDGLVPYGVDLALKVTSAFVHDMPLSSGLLYEDAFQSIRREGWGGLSDFIRRVFVDNDWHTEFVLLASDTLAERKERSEKLRMRMVRSRMSNEDIAHVQAQQCRLMAYHDASEDPAALAALPKTERRDLSMEAPALPLSVDTVKNEKILYLDSKENVVRMTVFFPVNRFDDDFLHSLGLLCLLFGKTGTSEKTVEQVNDDISRLTGGVALVPSRYSGSHEQLFLELRCGMLPNSFAEGQKLLKELLQSSDYSCSKLLHDALAQYLRSAKAHIPTPSNRVCAYFSNGAAALERCAGTAFTDYVQSLLQAEDFDRLFPQLYVQICEVAETVFTSGNQTVGIACAETLRQQAEEQLSFSSSLHEAVACTAELMKPCEVFHANGVMQYTALGGKVAQQSGALLAACAAGELIMRRTLREIRGAYIVRLYTTEEGEVLFQTGRDPQLSMTLETFREIPDLICALDDEALNRAVMNAAENFFGISGRADIGGFKKREVSVAAFRSYWNGLVGEDRQRLWKELITASPQQIRAAAEQLRPICEGKNYCSWASDKQIAESASYFNTVR